MIYALDAHFALAFLVLLCALTLGWIQMGRRVMVALLGLQVALGIVVAAWDGFVHAALPRNIWLHILGGLLAMGAYIAARRIVDRDANAATLGFALSFAGLVLVALTLWLGAMLVARGI